MFTSHSRLAFDPQIPCLPKVALLGLRQARDEETESDGATEGSRAKEARGCKDGERQINERKGREDWANEIFREKNRRGRREETFQDETALSPPTTTTASSPSPLPGLIEPPWLNSSGIHKAPSLTPTSPALSVMDGMRGLGPLWITIPVIFCVTPPPTSAVGGWNKMGGERGTGFWSFFPPLSAPVMRVLLWQW